MSKKKQEDPPATPEVDEPIDSRSMQLTDDETFVHCVVETYDLHEYYYVADAVRELTMYPAHDDVLHLERAVWLIQREIKRRGES